MESKGQPSQALRCLGKEVANEAETPLWKQTIYDKTPTYLVESSEDAMN